MKSRVPRKSQTRSSDEKQLERLLRNAAEQLAARAGKAAIEPVAPSAAAPPASKKEPRLPSLRKSPVREEIAVRAYHLYLQRGAGDGWDWADWFQAEGEISAKEQGKRGRPYSQSRG